MWRLVTKPSKLKRFFEKIHNALNGLYTALYGFILHFFKSVNRKVWSKLPVRRMSEETSEHVRLAVKVFKWVVLPASLLYIWIDFYFFKTNAIDSMFWGLLIFFYSSFLPDVPSIFRRKTNRRRVGDLPWYKKYSLLLFAPLLIWLLFSGMRLRWKTTETFHNFKSLTIYGTFLFLLSLFAFGTVPISLGDITEILSIPLYGAIGYLTHLKVDKIW